MRRAVPFLTRCCRTARSWRTERIPPQPPPRPPPPMPWPRILMAATYCRRSPDLVRDSESVRTSRRTGPGERTGSIGPGTSDHGHGGFENDLQVPPQRPRGHVEVVELHEVLAGQVI